MITRAKRSQRVEMRETLHVVSGFRDFRGAGMSEGDFKETGQ